MNLRYFDHFLFESLSVKVDWSLLTIEDGKILTYHYSDVDIKDGMVKIGQSSNRHSKSEFRTWGRSRSFFYCVRNGFNKDNIGKSHRFTYQCLFDVDKVYDINRNPMNFKPGKYFFESMYQQTRNAGFTAWIYNLGQDPNNPIIVSFVDMPIHKASKIGEGGFPVEKDAVFNDYKIGSIEFAGKKWDVIQQGEYLRSFTNCYIKRGKEKKNFSNFDYLFKKVEVLPEFRKDYQIGRQLGR